eukprot:scaffold8091_cov120-Isochrysis_galbana.AAC.1
MSNRPVRGCEQCAYARLGAAAAQSARPLSFQPCHMRTAPPGSCRAARARRARVLTDLCCVWGELRSVQCHVGYSKKHLCSNKLSLLSRDVKTTNNAETPHIDLPLRDAIYT